MIGLQWSRRSPLEAGIHARIVRGPKGKPELDVQVDDWVLHSTDITNEEFDAALDKVTDEIIARHNMGTRHYQALVRARLLELARERSR